VALPGHLAALLADGDALLVGRPGGMSEQTLARLRGMEEEYAGWCARLDDSGIPPSLQHDDLHDGNVFVRPGGYAIVDWGDAVVAHPFGSLLVALRSIAARFGLPPGSAESRRLRDADLERWSEGRGRPSWPRSWSSRCASPRWGARWAGSGRWPEWPARSARSMPRRCPAGSRSCSERPPVRSCQHA